MRNNLDFLNKFKENNRYGEISFFKSDFEDSIWVFELKKKQQNKTIDFNMKLQDNSLLTEHKNRDILYTFKTLIMEFLLSDDMHRNADDTISQGLNGIMHFIGLINSFDSDKLFAKHGLKVVNKDFLMNIINRRLDSNNLFYVYNGESLLNGFLQKNKLYKKNYNKSDVAEIENFIKNNNIDIQKEVFPYQFCSISFSLNKVLLNKNKIDSHKTEYEGCFRYEIEENKSSVSTAIKPFIKCLKILKEMHKLEDNRLSLPFKEDIDYILNYNFESKDLKHFETYPFNTILKVFKSSLDFHFEYGNDIVDSFILFLDNLEKNNESIKKSNKPISKLNIEEIDLLVENSLVGKLKTENVESFLINDENNYFNDLRENKSLYNLLVVYYGCVQFVIGALMARRQSEINSMEVDCFDEVNLQLNFRKSKSYQHSFGIRDYISLPCPEIVIEMIKNINKISKRLNDNEEVKRLFFIPKSENPLFQKQCKKTIYKNFDHMFDYFEVDLIDGKRPYIRQHQLRRFFAMSFFWSSGFKSIDTLRWFLGHTNAEHVYHYIKENTNGEVLNNVKAQYISENIKDYESLEEIFENKYNISDYNLIDKEDLADYINAMLEDGMITVEPEFIENDEGQKFEIIVKVKNND